MTVRTRTPDTAARARGISPDVENHTKQMLESILRPHSLEELYALVGSFPFKAVKVCQARGGNWPVGKVLAVVGIAELPRHFLTDQEDATTIWSTPADLKQWRLAE